MHLGINHKNCSNEDLFNAFYKGELWKHVLFRVYKHEICPITGRSESYFPIFTCNNLYLNFKSAEESVKKKNPNYLSQLGEFSHVRLCTPEDEKLLSVKMITQGFLISFNPNRKGRGKYLNRKLLKVLLPSKYHFLITSARRQPKYNFIKQSVDDELPISLESIWQTVNSNKISELLLRKVRH